jgi:lipopolysaccharide transport system ATP-binding protein
VSPAIRIDKVGKCYRVHGGERRLGYRTLREALSQAARAPLHALRRRRASAKGEDFWALRDVSLDVRPGEVLGVIGRNGAGKSTLLKILSRITKPTTGRIHLRGRVGSLLEVGTGFHPELTGRENVFLNGAILGMSRREILRKFDEIVDFAGVDKFLDTPVKRYSSGMYVRLAFAVAAHLEPDILMIDEVLAVGDASFQKKCLGKMNEVAHEGRTVLFVSHDLANISRLCTRAVLLSAGEVEAIGEPGEVIAQYVPSDLNVHAGLTDLSRRGDRSGNGEARFQSIEINYPNPTNVCRFEEEFNISLVVKVARPIGSAQIAIVVLTDDGIAVHTLWSDSLEWPALEGIHKLTAHVPQLRLYPGPYHINLWMGDASSDRIDFIQHATTFQVVQTSESTVTRPLRRSHGLVYQDSIWSYEGPEA